jgi:uncharacterized phage protein (TIGR01671 family)
VGIVSREIRFRAWDKWNGGMTYDVQKAYDSQYGNFYERNFWDYLGEPGFNCETEKEELRYKVMEYTGLKDKNGKEIWEGDIVHYVYDHEGTDNWEVVWDYDTWVMKRGDWHTGDGNLDDDPHYNVWEESEVIGNIYENSELLGGKSER